MSSQVSRSLKEVLQNARPHLGPVTEVIRLTVVVGGTPVGREQMPELLQGVVAGQRLQLRLHHLQADPGRDRHVAAHKLEMGQRMQAAQV